MANAPARIRMDPEQRKARLRASARHVFATNGYTATGLIEVAEHAGVSKGLLYHYYPAGRPELYLAVMDELHAEFLTAVQPALHAPFRTERRVELFVEAFTGFFDRNRDAHRLLFAEPPGSGEDEIVQRAAAVVLSLQSELAKAFATLGARPEVLVVAAAGTTGFLLGLVELLAERRVDRPTAIVAATAFLNGGLQGLT